MSSEIEAPPETHFCGNRLQDIVRRNRASETVGVYAVCSAHPAVIAAAAQEACENQSVLQVESTSGQVNQFGGYTGQLPVQFAAFVRDTARKAGLNPHCVLLGGDHLGPFPWRGEDSAIAMEKARALVRGCVLAGYQKIHLDASMACGDDPKPALDERTVATRAADLCETAEKAFHELPPNSPPLLYVVGTEVPVPGGESHAEEAISVTTPQHVKSTVDVFQRAFKDRGLEEAWERVIGLVVQPGVEFGDANIFEYDRAKAGVLSAALPSHPQLVFEAHSTDYQLPSSLKEMVGDHFAILKVGPWLTFAFREAILALAEIEREIVSGKNKRTSQIRKALEAAMLRNPGYWRDYYHGDEAELRIARAFSYSDRCRYYWHEAEVKTEIELLLENLTTYSPPLSLISQYLPQEYERSRTTGLQPSPQEMVANHIRRVLRKYAFACGENKASA